MTEIDLLPPEQRHLCKGESLLFFFSFFFLLFSSLSLFSCTAIHLLVCSICTPGVWITPSVFHVHCFVRVVLRFLFLHVCVSERVSASSDEMK